MKTRNVLIGIGIALALVALVGGGWLLGSQLWGAGCWQSGVGVAFAPGMHSGASAGSYGSPWGMHTFGGGILMFLFWGAIIGGGVLLAAGLARHRQGSPASGISVGTSQRATPASRSESPLEILKRRYASGEIDREEFQRMKEILSS